MQSKGQTHTLSLCLVIMEIIAAFVRLEKWVFEFPGRLEISIHHSLTSRGLLLAVRVLSLLVLSFRYVLSILTYHSAFNILEYLTELAYITTWVYFALTLEDYLLNEAAKQKKAKRLGGWIGLMFELALGMEIIVSVLFWSVLYDYSKQFQVVGFLKEFGVHGFPLVCLLLDLSLNVYQFPKRHLWIVIIFGLAYLSLNIGYSFAVEPVYRPLNWITLMSYVYVISSILVILATHTLIRKYWQRYRQPCLLSLAEGYCSMGEQLAPQQ